MQPSGLADRRDTHQTIRLDPVIRPDEGEEIREIRGGDAGFLRLFAGIDLDENARRPAGLVHRLAQSCGQFRPIECLDHVEEGNGIHRLVGLQGSDQTQFQIRMGRTAVLPVFLGFLDPVFSEDPLSRGEGSVDAVRRLAFRDGDQTDIIRFAASRLRRGGNPLKDAGMPGREIG